MPLQKLPGSPADTPEVDVAEAARVWRDGSAQVVDVREPDEWEAGRIPGSIHIPLSDLGQRAGELAAEIPVVVVCRVGVRSLAGAEYLLTRGFHDVASLDGGLVAWAEAGHPVES